MSRDIVLLTLARALGDLGIGAAIGFSFALGTAPAAAAVVCGGIGLALGVRLAEKKGRRTRIAGQLLGLAAVGGALVPRSAALGFALATGAAAVASMLLLRERADRTKERPRITSTVVALGGGAAVAHAAPLGPSQTGSALALLSFGGALAAMSAALFVGPGRPPPRALDVAVFLALGGAAVVALSLSDH